MASIPLKRKFKRFIKRDLFSWLIMLPSICLFIFYIWSPLLSNVILSFFTTKGMTKVNFVGFNQYLDVFTDPNFIKTLENTLLYVFWSIIIGFILPILLAIILNEIVHATGIFRALVYLPNIIPGIAAIVVWMTLFNPNPSGTLNSIFGTECLFLNDTKLVIPLIILTMTWKGAGSTCLIYLASLQTIDETYYEAARIEGANMFNRFRYVTFPHLLEQIKVLFILQIISVFQVCYEPMVMAKDGGPSGSSRSLVELIYDYAFSEYNAGKAAALSVIVAIILFSLSIIYFMINRKKGERND